MIDFHSHILPNMDDGSSNLEESIELLKMLSEQGADTVFATSHFYANHESVTEFLERRQAAFELLQAHLFENAPEIRLGAEVRYYEGISRMEGLESLCIQGTRLLLLEMSVRRWSEYTIRELTNMASSGRFVVVLAHIERYFDFQSKAVWKRLLECGVLMQVNATSIVDRRFRRKCFGLLKKEIVHFIGSDCHNVELRPPYMDEAFALIEKKFGSEYLQAMLEFNQNFI